MRVFDKEKINELTKYNVYKGYLKNDKVLISHHEAVEAVEEQGHYETIAEYPNGGKDVEWVVDVPKVEAKEAYDEYEDIQVYIPYTDEELAKKKEEHEECLIEQYIRERYSISQEIGILRKRDEEPEKAKKHYDYVEECIVRARAEISILYS